MQERPYLCASPILAQVLQRTVQKSTRERKNQRGWLGGRQFLDVPEYFVWRSRSRMCVMILLSAGQEVNNWL